MHLHCVCFIKITIYGIRLHSIEPFCNPHWHCMEGVGKGVVFSGLPGHCRFLHIGQLGNLTPTLVGQNVGVNCQFQNQNRVSQNVWMVNS